MIEETDLVFDLEDGQHRGVDLRRRYSSARDQLGEILLVRLTRHVHAGAGGDRLVYGVGRIGRVAVCLKTGDRECVRRHETMKFPFRAKNVGEEPAISTGGNVIQIHVGRHQTANALLHCGVERNQIHVPHQFFGNVGGVVIAASLGRPVSSVVLDARDHAVRSECGALKSTHLCLGHGSAEVGIFARAFLNAAPSCVARDVNHRRERPPDARGLGLSGGQRLRLFLHGRIP